MGLDISVYRPKKLTGSPDSVDTEDFWIIEDDTELSIFKDFFFEKEIEFYDFEEPMKNMGYDLKDFYNGGMEFGPDATFDLVHREEGFKITLVNPPTIKIKKTGFIYEEVGYQRKGANKKFYEDGMWDSPCITDSKTLNEHWEKYFSYQTPDSKGGWGSVVEYSLEDEEMRRGFKENIIDKFVEGETFVIYH